MKPMTPPYLALAFLTGLNLLNYLDRYVLASVVPPLKADLLLTDTQIGWLTSAFMIGYFPAAPIFGWLGDRGPRKRLIALGVVFWSVATLASAFCHQFWTLFACRIVVGVGEASFAVAAPVWVAELWPAARRNTALTLFYAATPVGSALGYFVGGIAVAGGDWRNGFLWAGGPGLVLALALLALSEPSPARNAGHENTGASVPRRDGIAGFASLFKITDYLLILAGLTAYTFALGAFAAWGPTFLTRVHGLELSFADKFFGGALVVGGLIGTLAGGFAASVWRRRTKAGYAYLLTLSAVTTVLASTAAFLTASAEISMICLAAAIVLSFLPMGPTNTLLIESVPPQLRASAMAASIFVIHIFGDFWSPVLVGRLAEWNYRPDVPGAGLKEALLLLPTVLSLAMLFWGWLAVRLRNRDRSS